MPGDFVIDCSQNWIPNIDVEAQAATTGEYVPTDVTGINMVLSAARNSATPLDASLDVAAQVRSGYTGRIYGTFNVADLQSHVLAYAGQYLWLNLFKSGVLVGEAFRCYVQPDRLKKT